MDFIKKYHINILKLLAVIAGAGELFLSGSAISSFKNVSSEIYGFYYFIFILFGLVLIFNILYIDKNFKALISACAAGLFCGIVGTFVFERMLSTNITNNFMEIFEGAIVILIGTIIYYIIFIMLTIKIVIDSFSKRKVNGRS